MKIWSFLFADPTTTIVSARVAAPSKMFATALLGAFLKADLTNAEGMVCQWAGEDYCEAGVILRTIVLRKAA
jgi:hypothetical protein